MSALSALSASHGPPQQAEISILFNELFGLENYYITIVCIGQSSKIRLMRHFVVYYNLEGEGG